MLTLELRIMNICAFAKIDANTNITKTRNAIKKAAIKELVKSGKIDASEEKGWIKCIPNTHFFEGYSLPVLCGLITKILEVKDVKKEEIQYNTYKISIENNQTKEVQGLEYNSKIEGLKDLKLFIYKNELNNYVVSELYSGICLASCKYKKDIENRLNDLLNALGSIKNLQAKLNEFINKAIQNNNFKPLNGEKVEYDFFITEEKSVNPTEVKTSQNINLFIKKDHVLIMTQKSTYTNNLFILKDDKIEFLKAGDKIDLYREFLKDREYKKELYFGNNGYKSVSVNDIKTELINTYLKEVVSPEDTTQEVKTIETIRNNFLNKGIDKKDFIRLVKALSNTLNKDTKGILEIVENSSNDIIFSLKYDKEDNIKNIILACVKPCLILKEIIEPEEVATNTQEQKEIKINLNDNLLKDIDNNNLKASKLIQFLLENNFKSSIKDLNKIAIKDLCYNNKRVLDAIILDKSIKFKLE